MPVLIKDQRAVLFIHIPKTGGSSVVADLADYGWRELFSIRGVSSDDLSFTKASPQHFHADLLASIFNFSEFESVFAVTRHPFNRVKSEYYWHFRDSQTKPDPKTWLEDCFAKARRNPYLNDNHIRPQVEFIPKDADVSIFKLEEDGIRKAQIEIFGYEDRPKPKSLKERLRPSKPKREKASKYDENVENAFAAQRALINDFYAADFEQFGYDPDGS